MFLASSTFFCTTFSKRFRLLRFMVSASFRSPRSRRMAGWMWLRCILGPHLQRIHRSPDQSRPEGRAGRRVGMSIMFCTCLSTAILRKRDTFSPVSIHVAAGSVPEVSCVCYWKRAVTAPNSSYMNETTDHTHQHDVLLMFTSFLFHCHSNSPWAAASYTVFLNDISYISLVMLMLSVIVSHCQQGWTYQPRSLEKHTDSILGWVSMFAWLIIDYYIGYDSVGRMYKFCMSQVCVLCSSRLQHCGLCHTTAPLFSSVICTGKVGYKLLWSY